MNKILLILLIVLLGVLGLAGFFLYPEYKNMQQTLRESEKKIADLNRKNAELTEAQSQLQSQSRECTESLKTLEEKKEQLLKESEQKIPELKKKILLLTEERDKLQSQLQKCTENLRELEKTLGALKDETVLTKSQIDQIKSTYEALASDLKEQIQKQEVTINKFQKELSVSFVDRILFDFGKAALTKEGEKVLKKVGEVLKKIKEKRIRIIGHTDNIPIHPDYRYKFRSNWELSAARAASVVRYFQENINLDGKDMEAVGCSFYQPVATNETEEGRALNRRVEIIIAPRMEMQKK
jgi:chemotaxis protein MotB